MRTDRQRHARQGRRVVRIGLPVARGARGCDSNDDRDRAGGRNQPGPMIPIGLNPTTINVSSEWWLQAARDAESAGFKGIWSWDHFVSRGHKSAPVLECWTTLTAAAAVTSRLHVGSFVTNVMNRHPAVLARMLATIW